MSRLKDSVVNLVGFMSRLHEGGCNNQEGLLIYICFLLFFSSFFGVEERFQLQHGFRLVGVDDGLDFQVESKTHWFV